MKELVLGIETSCDETSAGIIDGDGVVLANIVYSQTDLHKKYGGVVPELASRDHALKIDMVVKEALLKAKIKADELSCIAVTSGPGLLGCVLVGLSFAKAFALSLNKPLIGVDHVKAHAFSALLKRDAEDIDKPEYPFLSLVVSGGHTSIYVVRSHGDVKRIASTVDDAVGEVFDKVARFLGLGYPGGKALSERARLGAPESYKFSTPKVKANLYDFSFSGLKTAALNYIKGIGLDDQISLNNLLASLQEAVCNILIDKFFLVAKDTGIKNLVIGGGVAANYRLRDLLQTRAREQNYRAWLVPMDYCTDNAVMIANYARLDLSYRGTKNFSKQMAGLPAYSTIRR